MQIKNFSQQKDKVSITSDRFYMAEYRFFIKVYPNGDGVGRNTHLSVFFGLTKGDNDEQLQWPFRGVIKMSLLNEEEEVLICDKMTTYYNTACFNKPGDEANVATGFPKFYNLDRLDSHFWYYDTISIKFEIVELFPPRMDNKQVLQI